MRDIGCARWYLFFVHLEQYTDGDRRPSRHDRPRANNSGLVSAVVSSNVEGLRSGHTGQDGR